MSINNLNVLFIPFDGVGHLNPMIALSETLLVAGHHIVFLMSDKWQGMLNTTRPNFATVFYGSQNQSHELAREHGQFQDELTLQQVLFCEKSPDEKMLANYKSEPQNWVQILPQMDAHIERAIREVRPDVIVVDCALALPSIERSGVPWVCVNTANPLYHIFDSRTPPFGTGYPALGDQNEWKTYRKRAIADTRGVCQELNAYYVSKGCEPLPIGQLFKHSPYLNVYQFPIELDYQEMRPNPPKHCRFDHFMSPGSNVPLFKVPVTLADKPGKLVYLSLGSVLAGNVHNMKRLVNILAKSKHRFIVSKGPKHETYELPDNMYGQKYVPQNEIVQLVDLVITHGGNNTVCEVFAAGKPMIVLPHNNDQYNNAQRVDELGFGVRLDAYKCTSGQLLAAIDRLLNDKELHERLAIIADRIKRDNSIAKFPQLVENIVIK